MRLVCILSLMSFLCFACDDGSKPPDTHNANNANNINNINNTNNINNINNINNGGFVLLTLPGLRLGINLGHRNVAWSDRQTSDLATRVGVTSARISLPMTHLETWGYGVELSDIQYYRDHGMDRHLVAFLTRPSAACSTAPAGTPDWELAHYVPSGLYEPIWSSPGVVNPANCWARHVFETVRTYHDLIDIWEIWNEPDWVSDWRHTLTWWETPPTADQLPRFHGGIFEYIRLLRVSAEVIRAVDPEALVATGGLGYPSFVDALLRYTDNPADGSVTAAHPHRGGHWFDVHAIHYYPIFGGGNSDRGAAGFLEHLEEHLAVLAARAAGPKAIIVTESGAPHVAVGDAPGGAAYARNYLMKLVVLAAAAGVSGVDWFLLTDTAPVESPGDPFDVMGLYLDTLGLSDPADAVTTETGIAHATVAALLGDAVSFSPLAQEVTGEGFDGVAVQLPERGGLVLWAVGDAGEDATTTVTLADGRAMEAYFWDHAVRPEAWRTYAAGEPVELTASPIILLEP